MLNHRYPQPILHSMIFKTFDGKIDKWTSRIGIFGKSFNELGTAVNDAFKSVIDNIDNFDKNVSFWESLKSNLFSKKDNDKDWIKNSLGEIISQENIDSYIKELDLSSAKNKLKEIFDWQEDIANGETTWEKFFETCKGGNEYIIELIKTTDDLSKLTGEDLVKANQQARASALAHNEAIKAQTLSAKAGSVALKALSIAGNMLAVWAITKGIELAVKGIDNIAHSAEHCKERVDELMTSYKSALDKANSNAKTIEELASKYEELSKGVNNLGENVSLATDEYTEYNKIVNQIADMFPTMVQGYTNEGNAILSLKGNVEELRDAYKEAQQEAYNLLIASGKDSDGNDIIKNWNNISSKGGISFVAHTSEVEARDALQHLYKIANSGSVDLFKNIFNTYEKQFAGSFSKISNAIDKSNWVNLTEEDLKSMLPTIYSYIQTYQAEIDSALKNVQTLANAYLMTNEDYAKLNDQSKNAVSIIVNSINENIASSFENKEAVGTYVDGLVDSIKDNPEIQDALIGLFTLNTSNMPVKEARSLIDTYIGYIANEIGESPLELKIRLGFDDITDTAKRLQNSIRQITDDHGISDLEEYSTLSEYTKDFTQAQVELWLEATLGAENATQAVKMYEEAIEVAKNADENPISLFDQLTSSKDSLDKFQSSIKSAADAYATLLSGNYSSTELLDSIQAINQAATDMGESIAWEEIDSLDLLGDKLEEVSQKYAESILSGVGIDVNSDFGKILTDIISQMYEAEAEFTGMNAQLDRLQSSYQTLTGILESYNETGHVSLDNLQSLLTADENLIAMLEVENGKLVINQAAYENLVAVQLLEFKAKLNDAAAAEIETLALNKAEEATNNNAKASEDAVAKLNAETEAFNRNTSAAIANAMAKAEESGVSEEEIQGVLDKYTEIWNAAKDNYNTDFPKFMNGVKSSASSASKSVGEAFADALDKELAALDKKMEVGYIDFNDYIQARLALIEDYYNHGKLSADKYYSYLEKHYNTQLSYMNKVVNAVTRRIDTELDALKQQKEDVEDIYKIQIESLEKEKTLLEEANKERQRQIDLQKSLYDLERARNQRTKLVYSEDKGMHYVADDQSIRNAQEDVDNARYDIKISEIEKSISNLEEARDKQTDAIDQMISNLEAYKDSWNNITSAYEEEQENLIAAQILGANWETNILNGRLDVLDAFKNQYISMQQAMADAAWKSANEQVKAAKEAEKGSSGSTSKAPKIDTKKDTSQPSKISGGGGGNGGGLHSLGLGGNKLVYANLKAYASGTSNAKKGLNLVGEDGTETYFDNHGHVAIVTKPTLIPMEGGEVVKNQRDTKKLLDPDNLAPVDTIGLANIDGKEAEYTIKVNVETNGEIPDVKDRSLTKAEAITPQDDKMWATVSHEELIQKLLQYAPALSKQVQMYPKMDMLERMGKSTTEMGRSLEDIMNPMHIIAHNMQEMTGIDKHINNVSSVVNNTRNMQPVINGGINITCPGVTSQEVAKQLPDALDKALDRKFNGFSNYADQWIRR